jgi:hypothetical protein
MIVVKNNFGESSFIRISHPEGTDTDPVEIKPGDQHVFMRPVGEALLSNRFYSLNGYEAVCKIFSPGNFTIGADSLLKDGNGVHIGWSCSTPFKATWGNTVSTDSSGMANISLSNQVDLTIYVRISNNGGTGSEDVFPIYPNQSDSWKRPLGASYKLQFFFNSADPSMNSCSPVYYVYPGNTYKFVRGDMDSVSLRHSDGTYPKLEMGYFK